MVTHWRSGSGHRFLAASLLALGGLGATAVYDSEEHKMIADRGAGLVNQGSAQLPAGTRFETSTPTEALSMYRSAKLLAVGISSNSPGEYSDQTKKVLATLTPREEQVLRLRFGIGERTDFTLEEVGARFAVTRERMRQIESKALRKLRHPIRARRLRGFLDG